MSEGVSVSVPIHMHLMNLVIHSSASEMITFYCVNTSYPMDNSLSGRRRPARQTPEKDVLCLH